MMEMAQNPKLLQEMKRNTDLSLAHIENMPGGFDAIRRAYNSMEPMMESFDVRLFI